MRDGLADSMKHAQPDGRVGPRLADVGDERQQPRSVPLEPLDRQRLVGALPARRILPTKDCAVSRERWSSTGLRDPTLQRSAGTRAGRRTAGVQLDQVDLATELLRVGAEELVDSIFGLARRVIVGLARKFVLILRSQFVLGSARQTSSP